MTQPIDAIETAFRFTPVVFDGHTRSWGDSAHVLVTWDLPTHRTPIDINLELAQRISSSLHRDSARAILWRVQLVASRDALRTPWT